MNKVSQKTSNNLASSIFNKIDILNSLIKDKNSSVEILNSIVEFFTEQYSSVYTHIIDRKDYNKCGSINCLVSNCETCSNCIFNYVYYANSPYSKGEIRDLYFNFSNYARYHHENVFCDLDVINIDEIQKEEYTGIVEDLIAQGIKTITFISTRKDYCLESLIMTCFKEKLNTAVINSLKFVIPYIFLSIYNYKCQEDNVLMDFYNKPFKSFDEDEKVGFAFLDSNYNLIKSNYNFRKIYQLSPNGTQQCKNILEKISEAEQQMMFKALEETNKYTKFLDLKDDSEKHSYIKFEMLKSIADKDTYYFIYLSEVTEKYFLENQLQKKIRELKIKNQEIEIQKDKVIEASKIKNQFLANISHELRTPLNAIIGFSEVLLSEIYGKLSEKQEEYSNYINDSGYHLLNLINDILDLSKIEAGKIKLKKETIYIREEFLSVLRLLDNPIKDKGLKIELNVPEDQTLKVDKKRFRQIILNILENARKFSNNGGTIKIDSKLDTKSNNYEISIEDNGIGIDDEHKEFIFEPFKQVDAEYTRRTEGVGLGLALVKSFVEQHKGKIWCEGELNKGAKFTFTIPANVESDRLVILYISNKEVPENFNTLVNSLDANLDYYNLTNNFSLQEKIDNIDLILANSDLSGNQINEVIQRYFLLDNPDKVPLYISSTQSDEEFVLNNIRLTNTDLGIKEFLNTDYSLLNCFDKSYKSFCVIYTQNNYVFNELNKQFDKNVFEVIQVKSIKELIEITSDFSLSTILLDASISSNEKEEALKIIKANTFNKTLRALVVPFTDDSLNINSKEIMGDEYSLKKVINNIKIKNKWRI